MPLAAYEGMSPTELVDRILETHHALLKRELPRLSKALETDGGALQAPFEQLKGELEVHLRKEETVLFPAIRALEEGEDTGELCRCATLQMEREHDVIGSLEMAARNASRGHPLEEEVLAVLDDLAVHAALEDRELFPAVRALAAPVREERIRETRGCCSVCVEDVPAAVNVRDRAVWLDKECPTHGRTSQLLSNEPAYWSELDRFYFKVNEKSYPQRDFIVRMTETCNLQCPICLAAANTRDTPDLDLSGLEQLLSERRGIKVDLMAAEPTLRKDLEQWIRRVKDTGNIAALHTNGIKLASKRYAKRLADAGMDEVFLQFDGFDDDANEALRGQRLLKQRLKAVANLKELGVATSLIVVVGRGLNEAEISNTLRFALQPENTHIREVFFMGLRMLGSARTATEFDDMQLMPDELISLLCEQEPDIKRADIRRFNKLYFSLLSELKVKKCLYVQHYMVARDGQGGMVPASDFVNLPALEAVCDDYAERLQKHPVQARLRLLPELARGLTRKSARMAFDLLKMQRLLSSGMNLGEVPDRFLLLGFITACDPHNFDAQVAINCGKGELSVDGGFVDNGAQANVDREFRDLQK
jgi:molybdenum cofactor biosynthesis enzyme MoaA